MYGSIWSLVPFLVVIPVAILTRQVLPGLVVGLFIGSFMLHPTLLGGVNTALDYILKELAIPDNLRLIVFLYGFGSFVGLVRVTGGVSGFAEWMSRRIQTTKGAFAVTWLSSLATFMAPDFRIITVAPVMKQLFERMKVPAQKVAFVIEVTSTPLTALIPIGTAFVGYMVGLINTAGRHHGLSGSAYHMFLLSIPLNFFSILMLGYGLVATFMGGQHRTRSVAHQKIPTFSAESRLRMASQLTQAEAAAEFTPRPPRPSDGDEYVDPVEVLSERVPPRLLNLALPLGLLLALTLFLTWWSGHAKATGFLDALTKANAAQAMLQALLITLVLSMVWYTVQGQPMQRTLFGVLGGGNEMMSVIVLLVLVWAVSAVSNDLGFTTYTERAIGHLVPDALIAPALFLFGCLLSYVLGSSFGTWGMLLPLGLSLAAGTNASVPLIVGAVFASGTFGGFASPLSDNTVATATVMKLPLLDYSRYKLKPALFVAGGCCVLYALAGWLFPHFV